ncbi:MAG: SDR family NAD(P)-dependent oxidoreductase, partial [Candidatus Margulisiibacteriota bacterium]
FAPVTEDSLAGGLSNTIAGRICNFLDLHGGGYTVDGACSSSILSIITAISSLNSFDFDLAIAGGVDISLDTFELVGFAKTGALTAKDMTVYDKAGSGFIPGEGCGFVVLKRLAEAEKDGDKIYAVIKGYGISSDGKGGITAPSASGQSYALQRAYNKADYAPADLNFIEGHGTGTTVGDKIELLGVIETFKAFKENSVKQCGMTSLKSIVGHTKAAAGVGAFIKTVMALNQRILPPTANCKNPHAVFESSDGQFIYPIRDGEIKPADQILRAGVSAMGFGGINSHITLESGSKPYEHLKPSVSESALFVSKQDTEILTFSASSLEELIAGLKEASLQAEGISLAEIIDFAQKINLEVDDNLEYKAAVLINSPDDIQDKLSLLMKNIEELSDLSSNLLINNMAAGLWLAKGQTAPKIGFLFPGQGAQQLNMARFLIQRFDWAKEFAENFNHELIKLGSLDILSKIYCSLDQAKDKEEQQKWFTELSNTKIAQPAIILCSLLWEEYLKRLNILPCAVLGHSLGELTAFYSAGAIDLQTLIRLVSLRSSAMSQVSETGQMLSLNCDLETASDLVKQASDYAVIANINSPKQIIVSGSTKGIQSLIELANAKQVINKVLPVSNAFHSKLMQEAVEIIKNSSINFEKNQERLKTKLFSALKNEEIKGINFDLKEYFIQQIISPVQFMPTLKKAASDCDVFVEVGPSSILSRLASDITDATPAFAVEGKVGTFTSLNQTLGFLFTIGQKINWPEVYSNRLVRPFVLASERKFIVNPLERPLAIANIKQASISNLNLPFLDKINAPKELISQYLNVKGGFIAKIIEEDLKISMSLSGDVADFSSDDATDFTEIQDQEAEDPIASQEEKITGSVAELLITLAAKRTGFEADTLSLDHRVLDDLNLDSIKSAELVAEAARALGLAGKVDPSTFANSTLNEIVLEFESKLQEADTEKTAINESNAMQTSWVRAFVLEKTEAKLPPVNFNNADLLNFEINNFKADTDTLQNLGTNEHAIFVVPATNFEADKFPLQTRISFLETIAKLNTLELKSLSVIHFRNEVSSFMASVHLEKPNLKIRVLDLPNTVEEKHLKVILLKELNQQELFLNVYYSDALDRFIERPKLLDEANLEPENLNLTNEDVVLVTGGAKGITAECVQALANQHKVKLALLGRTLMPENTPITTSPLNPPFKGGKEETDLSPQQKEIFNTLQKLHEAGIAAKYYACDVTNLEDLKKTTAKITEDLGQITGIIHGAGANKPRRAAQVSAEEALLEIAPKVQGLINLLTIFKDQKLKLIAAFSSIIGVTGMPGNAWYAYSNMLLKKLLQNYKTSHQSTKVQALAYSVWQEVGMGVRLGSVENLAKIGISAIPTADGVYYFNKLIDCDAQKLEIIITARVGGLDTWQQVIPAKPSASRFLEKTIAFEPGIELKTRTHLSLEKDLYLVDHNFKGSYLFPTVFGLEAMGQAVAYVTGRAELKAPLEIHNIKLERPIVVDPEAGLEIEIKAEVNSHPYMSTLSEEEKLSSQVIKVSISTEHSNFTLEHFSAEFHISDTSLLRSLLVDDLRLTSPLNPSFKGGNETPLTLDPKTELYGSILFQGERFQRIQEVYDLNEKETLFSSEIKSDAENQALAYAQDVATPFILGDPFFRDTMLQSVQLIVPQHICLPSSINSIEIFNSKAKTASNLHCDLQAKTETNLLGIVTNYLNNNELVEKISGYNLSIIEVIDERPSIKELLSPAKNYEKLVSNEIRKYCEILKIKCPTFAFSYIPNINSLKKEERHEFEIALFKDLIKNINKEETIIDASNLKLDWADSGKPIIKSSNNEISKFGVSFSHKGDFLFGVIGEGEQGCDIESVEARTKEEWLSILGIPYQALLDELIQNNFSLDEAGSIVWGSLESGKKSGLTQIPKITVNQIIDKNIVLSLDNLLIFTCPVNTVSKNRFFLSSIIKQNKNEYAVSKEKIIRTEDDFSAYTSIGPQGQEMYVNKFRLSFKDVSTKRRAANFFQYGFWMGKLREMPMKPIAEQLTKDMLSGEWGLVTNYSKIQVYGEAYPLDMIEGRIWTSKIWGDYGSSMDLTYDWQKIKPDGTKERIAKSFLSATWVKVIGHGKVTTAPLPKYLKTLMDKMAPSYENNNEFDNLPIQIITPKLNEFIYQNKNGLNNKKIIFKKIIETTQDDINFVGNVYYANYYYWQATTFSQFIFNFFPEYFQENTKNPYEFFCTNSKVDHLREAMPFDKIQITLSIVSLFKNGIELHYEYFRLNNNRQQEKLAIGTQMLVWSKKQRENKILIEDMPNYLLNKLQEIINLTPVLHASNLFRMNSQISNKKIIINKI